MVEKRTGHSPGADFVHLTKLIAQAVTLIQQKKVMDTALDAIKREIKGLIQQHESELPLDGSSRYWRIPTMGMQARLTYPSDTPVMDYDKLRLTVGDEVFGMITKPTGYELSLDEVNKALDGEQVTNNQLMGCLKTPPSRDVSLYIEKMTLEKKDAEEGV